MTELIKITQQELSDKLISGLDDTPGFSVSSMQARFDAHPNKNTEVINQHAFAQNQNNTDFEMRITENRTAVLKKVDKEIGKGLSQCDFTAIEKQKLGEINSADIVLNTSLRHQHQNKEILDMTSAVFTDGEKEKLQSVDQNANNYVLPVSSLGILGGVKPGYGVEVLSDGTLNGLAAPAPDLFAREQIDLHQQDKNNPHEISAFQVGAYSKTETDLKFAEKLNSNLTVYVSPTGSDSLGNGTETKPYATIQKAVDSLPAAFGQYTARILIEDGAYPENISIKGHKNLTIQAKKEAAGNVTINSISAIGCTNLTLNYLKYVGLNVDNLCSILLISSSAYIGYSTFDTTEVSPYTKAVHARVNTQLFAVGNAINGYAQAFEAEGSSTATSRANSGTNVTSHWSISSVIYLYDNALVATGTANVTHYGGQILG